VSPFDYNGMAVNTCSRNTVFQVASGKKSTRRDAEARQDDRCLTFDLVLSAWDNNVLRAVIFPPLRRSEQGPTEYPGTGKALRIQLYRESREKKNARLVTAHLTALPMLRCRHAGTYSTALAVGGIVVCVGVEVAVGVEVGVGGTTVMTTLAICALEPQYA
jgi:hypothetical protein